MIEWFLLYFGINFLIALWNTKTMVEKKQPDNEIVSSAMLLWILGIPVLVFYLPVWIGERIAKKRKKAK